jgi:hypothetical protein
MIIVKCDKDGSVTNIEESDDYIYLINLLNYIKEELEISGIFLISEDHNHRFNKTYQFASVNNGWECDYIMVDSIATGVKLNQNKDG